MANFHAEKKRLKKHIFKSPKKQAKNPIHNVLAIMNFLLLKNDFQRFQIFIDKSFMQK
jgi:hypothetical protein